MVFKLAYEVGSCKLGWLKSDKSPSPNSLYFNTKMKRKLKINVNEPYVMIN
jgi:hypothetical protein